jgi:hypothetical protein
MWKATCCLLISSWQQCIVASPCTDPACNTTLPHWHHVGQKTFQTCTLLNNVNSSMARSKMSDVTTMVMEERQAPSLQGLTNCSLCVVEEICESSSAQIWRVVASFCCVKCMCRYDLRDNLYELTALFQRRMLVTD